jgi:hypothetical protein
MIISGSRGIHLMGFEGIQWGVCFHDLRLFASSAALNPLFS